MPYLLDYLDTQFATFEREPFNPLDAAALTQFAMVRGKGVIPALHERADFADVRTVVRNALGPRRRPAHFCDLLRAEDFPTMFTGLDPDRLKQNLFALAASPRFRAMTASAYLSLFDVERETQFAAVTLTYKRDFAFIGFRGTDTSRTGWKEDFNMTFSAPVPAQEQALRYLETMAPHLPRRIYLGGHSKGGNLAEYAALKASPAVQERLERVFILDGPGFKDGLFTAEDYAPVLGKLHKVVPESSLVGILLDSQAPLRVAPSSAKGIAQHSVFTWEVDDGDHDFRYLDDLPDATKDTAATLRVWLSRYDDAERQQVVEALFRAIDASGAEDALDFLAGGPHALGLLTNAALRVDGADRAVVFDAVRSYVEVSANVAAANAGRAAQGAAITAQAVGEVVGEMIGEAVGGALDRVQSGRSPKERRLP
ncbi:Mbeg1-like protein [Adlercreutzia faecimuris]|uniref:DUF2974 domain-containing protein n=1 Tax=Adlercreutzia faecimuris TaxID=2897341 RepID=A0ABS9WD82_9ACTN|nr:Mbeg1-like protein [Adlercreutzia sp. JBNU-10]MCI2240818.1 DUF2974 domain-containing protein [Adlercreutzia sp. JBNU-10]